MKCGEKHCCNASVQVQSRGADLFIQVGFSFFVFTYILSTVTQNNVLHILNEINSEMQKVANMGDISVLFFPRRC